MENDYIILSFINNNKNISILQNLVELNFKDFNYDISDYYYDIEKEYILLIANSNDYSNIENICDNLRITYPTIRYNIQIYKHGEKFPSSIRINKQNKKKYTKKQTKFSGLI